MLRRIIFTGFLSIIPVLINNARGQDTLVVREDLKIQRNADSLIISAQLEKARQFYSGNQTDSAFSCLTKSINEASGNDFYYILAEGYELLATIYNDRSDWEETLRNYLRASAAFTKIKDRKNEASILKKIADKYFSMGFYLKSAQYAEQEFLLHSSTDYKSLASSSELAARSYYYLSEDSSAVVWYNKASGFYEKAGDSEGVTRCLSKTGLLSTNLGDYAPAMKKYNSLLELLKRNGDNRDIAITYNQIGFLMFRQNLADSALHYFDMAVNISEKNDPDNSLLTDVWSNIAICYQNKGLQDEMIRSFQTALKYARLSGRNDESARIDRILGLTYFNIGDNYHAELYFQECIEIAKASNDKDILQLCYKDYSSVLENGNDFVKALEFYEKYLGLRDSLNYNKILEEKMRSDRITALESTEQRIRNEISSEEIRGLEMKNLKAESLRKENEMNLLLKQQELDRSEKDRLAKSLALEQEKAITMEKEQKIKLLEQDKLMKQLEIEKQNEQEKALQNANMLALAEKNQAEMKAGKEKQIRKLFVGIGVLLLMVAVMILAGLISTRRKNQKLAESKKHIEKINTDLELKNVEILHQKDIIEQKNQSITDSIQYASRIQNAVLPPVDFIDDWGLDNFILFKPKDIVSGDFYWGVKQDGKLILAAGDCTGHGVPGAFMSMLGHAFLDEIVNTKEIDNAATILNLLRDEIINTLRQKGTAGEARDGMDISLVIMDLKARKIDYAGANNPLYIIRDGKMLKYVADRMPIGIHFISLTPFTNRTIDLKKNDYLFLFTDGYADQFGGPKGKKFMYKPFQELLLKNSHMPMDEQKKILDNTFEAWKGDQDQVDDVLVIGMHV